MYDSEYGKGLTQFKDGKHDGLQTYWYKNGQKKEERTFKDGKEHGIATQWYENGQKLVEGTFKDGKPDGLWAVWHENGQKRGEATFKDGKRVSEKYWNSKGEEFESEEEAFK